jgi:GNAT superfamily N-acetyltransferase
MNMENKVVIEELNLNEVNNVSSMVDNVFDKFVGKDYSVEGNNTFKDYIKPENIIKRFLEKRSIFFSAKIENIIIGMMEIKNIDHISLFFVKEEFHGKGIGNYLFSHYLKKIQDENMDIKTITVNSSIYVENIYIKLGFIKTNEIQEKGGIKYIPMEYKL